MPTRSPRPGTAHRRRAPVAAALVVLAGALAACSTSADRSSTTSTSAPGTTTTHPPRTTTTTHPPRTTTTTRPSSTTAPATTTPTTVAPGTTSRFEVPPVAAATSPLVPPANLTAIPGTPFAAGDGAWSPAGRHVGGHVAMETTTLPEPGDPALAAGVAWMDPHLLGAELYSGSESPGGGPWALTAPVQPGAATSLVAAFNGGFKWPSTEGGYYAYGQTVYPLQSGKASFVIYKNGTATVADWGRDATMTPAVAAVRQNLTLLVDGGRPVAGLNPSDTSVWGSTLGGIPNVWRSAVGVTADGALVYVAGPSLDVVQLAQLAVQAGAVRAMEMDINVFWPTFGIWGTTSDAPASATNGVSLLPTMEGTPARFFESWWARDFITMSARPTHQQ